MQDDLTLQAYHYDLPEENIAQYPADKRDQSQLLVLDRTAGTVDHLHFRDIVKLFTPGDLLVVNDTKVFPARLLGKKETGGKVEVFLLEFPVISEPDSTTAICQALIKASKKPKVGSKIVIDDLLYCEVLENLEGGKVRLEIYFDKDRGLAGCLDQSGQVPLPPYISRKQGFGRGNVITTFISLYEGALLAVRRLFC